MSEEATGTDAASTVEGAGTQPNGSVGDRAEHLKQELAEGYHDLEERYESTKDQVYEINRQAVKFIQEKPGVALLAAFGVGYVVGKFASRRWFV